MSIGHKGMLYAAKVMAATMVDLYADPAALAGVRQEFEGRTRGIEYVNYLPDAMGERLLKLMKNQGKQQAVTYWEGQIARAALIDEGLSEIARRFDGPDVEIWHDFAGVDALKATQMAALERIRAHVANGMDPVRAYHYEGFVDVDSGWAANLFPLFGQTASVAVRGSRR